MYNYITIHGANNIKNCILTDANLPQFIKKVLLCLNILFQHTNHQKVVTTSIKQ